MRHDGASMWRGFGVAVTFYFDPLEITGCIFKSRKDHIDMATSTTNGTSSAQRWKEMSKPEVGDWRVKGGLAQMLKLSLIHISEPTRPY